MKRAQEESVRAEASLVKSPVQESYDVKDHKMRTAVAMSVHRETLYTAKTLYNTVHSFQAIFDRYLGKPGSRAAAAAMAVDSGISRPIGLVDALTRIENLKVEVGDLTEALDTAKAEIVMQRQQGILREKTFVELLEDERREFEKERIKTKVMHDFDTKQLTRQLRAIKADVIERIVSQSPPFFKHSIFNTWRQVCVTRKLLEEEKSKVLTDLGDVGLRLLTIEGKAAQLRTKHFETRNALLNANERESELGMLRFVFSFWRATTQETKLASALVQEQTDRTSQVTQLQFEVEDARNAFNESRQDFRRSTKSLDALRDDHMQLKEEVQGLRAKSMAVDDQKRHFETELEKVNVENIQLRAKLSEALDTLAAAEAADSDLGLMFKKYRQLEKEYRILKKVMYPVDAAKHQTPTGVYQCSSCRAHVLHRSLVSEKSSSTQAPSMSSSFAATSTQFTHLPPLAGRSTLPASSFSAKSTWR